MNKQEEKIDEAKKILEKVKAKYKYCDFRLVENELDDLKINNEKDFEYEIRKFNESVKKLLEPNEHKEISDIDIKFKNGKFPTAIKDFVEFCNSQLYKEFVIDNKFMPMTKKYLSIVKKYRKIVDDNKKSYCNLYNTLVESNKDKVTYTSCRIKKGSSIADKLDMGKSINDLFGMTIVCTNPKDKDKVLDSIENINCGWKVCVDEEGNKIIKNYADNPKTDKSGNVIYNGINITLENEKQECAEVQIHDPSSYIYSSMTHYTYKKERPNYTKCNDDTSNTLEEKQQENSRILEQLGPYYDLPIGLGCTNSYKVVYDEEIVKDETLKGAGF